MDYRERWELKDYLFGRVLERRILLLHVGLTILLLVFVLNFWYLQVVHGDEYAGLAENNRLRRIPLRPTRGEIVDRERRVLASTRPSLDLLLRRERAAGIEGQLERLAPILQIPLEELQAKLREMDRRPIFEPMMVKEDVDLRELARIEVRREDFPSVEVRHSARRHYPERAMLAHAVGYVGEISEAQLAAGGGLEHGDIVGKSGIERTYDDPLRGQRGFMVASFNNVGRQVGDARVVTEPDHGSALEVTIDLRLQQTLVEGLGEEAGAGVFLDPRSGEVLAMASTPAFDPNLFADGITHDAWKEITSDPRRPLHDRSIASYYAPGSTFKVLMAITGLETRTVTSEDTSYCNGSTVIYGRRRLCWKRGGHGWVDIEKALAHSCNVYFYHLGQKLGIEPIHEYGAMFGLGQPTGIDIPGEEGGILPSNEWKLKTQREIWYPGDTISVAIGQGLLAVTPVQMARLMSGVATGSLPRPHVLLDTAPNTRALGISDSTLQVVRRGLERAVQSGTGRRATTGRFTVAGKTGTAQVYKHSAGIDSDELPKAERDHAWFVGYAPIDRPRIAFAVVVEHGGHGGTSAAPIVRQVLEEFFAAEKDPELQASVRESGGSNVGPSTAR